MQFTDSWDSAEVEIVDGLSKMALDVIGLAGEHQLRISTPVVSNIHIVQCCLRHFAGFDYDFHSLNTDGPPNKLKVALDYALQWSRKGQHAAQRAQAVVPWSAEHCRLRVSQSVSKLM